MDVTPELEEHILTVGGYGIDGVVVAGKAYPAPIAIIAHQLITLNQLTRDDLTKKETYQPFIDADNVSILLIGTGTTVVNIPPSLRKEMKEQHHITIEAMDTGAACRTYNVLVSESRPVATLLLPTV